MVVRGRAAAAVSTAEFSERVGEGVLMGENWLVRGLEAEGRGDQPGWTAFGA